MRSHQYLTTYDKYVDHILGLPGLPCVAYANIETASTDELAGKFLEFLNDYTTDRRGDIGSLIRVEAIQAVGILLQRESTSRSPLIQSLVGCLCRLACEKLDKVRLQAWLCLQGFWESARDFPPLER